MIMKFHEKGIRVVMDMVYNHMMCTINMDNIVPGYYFRQIISDDIQMVQVAETNLLPKSLWLESLLLIHACIGLKTIK